MKRLQGRVVSVSAGGADDLSKQEQESIEVNLSGIVGDHHAGASREAYDGEREPAELRVRCRCTRRGIPRRIR